MYIMPDLKMMEEELNNQINNCQISLAQEALEEAILKTQIASIDDTLYGFRDLAGFYLKTKKDGTIMSRYNKYKKELDRLVCLYNKRTGQDLSNRLKCNR